MALTQWRFSQSAKPSAIWREKKKSYRLAFSGSSALSAYSACFHNCMSTCFITSVLQNTYVKWTHFWQIESHSLSTEHHTPLPRSAPWPLHLSYISDILVRLFPHSINPLSKPSWLVRFILLWTAVAAASDLQVNKRPWSCTKAKVWHSN